MTETTLILRETERMGKKGRIIEAVFNGEVIASSTSPHFPACRELKGRGFDGMVYFRREGKPFWDLRMTVEWGATHTVSETNRQGLRFDKWAPHPMAGKLEEAA